MSSNPDRYKLDPEDHEAIYQDLKEDIFSGRTPSPQPRAIILGGQPGAGKSRALDTSAADFPGRNVVILNGDDYRRWHPLSNEILDTDEENYARLTDPDVREWTRRLLDEAVKERLNIVFESTMRSPEPITTTLVNLRKAGYLVTARVMAVHRFESITGIFRRYEQQKADIGHGRMAPLSVHDEAYTGLLNTLDSIQTRKAADRIHSLSRTGDTVCDLIVSDGEWEPSWSARNAVIGHRNQPVSLEMALRILTPWLEISEMMAERKADPSEFASVGGVCEEILDGIKPGIVLEKNPMMRISHQLKIGSIKKLFLACSRSDPKP